MKRAVFAVLTFVALMPSASSAQGMATSEPAWGPRIRLTPFVGQAPTVSRNERWALVNGDEVSIGDFDVDLGAGPAIGASLEFQVVDRFALIGSGMFINRGQTREFSSIDSEFFVSEGSNFLVGKVAAALRLRESASEMQLRQLTATIFAGPALLHEMPKDDAAVNPALLESVTHWGASFGVDAEIPMGQGPLSLQLGFEDFYTFWNTNELAARNDRAFAELGLTTESALEADASHMILIRAGMSIRFQ
jgi:hypothetical protein